MQSCKSPLTSRTKSPSLTNTRLFPTNLERRWKKFVSFPSKPLELRTFSCYCPRPSRSQIIHASFDPGRIATLAQNTALTCPNSFFGFEYLKDMFSNMFHSIFVADPPGGAENAVVRVSCERDVPDSDHPWQKDRDCSCGTAFVIEDKRVLTCAHCVEHQRKVTLKKQTSSKEYKATVLAISPECDLALLTVNNDEFWRGIRPLKLGNIPALKEHLILYGYPGGYDKLNKKSFFLSNVEMVRCLSWPSKFFVLQVNDEVRHGNSGGPVLDSRGDCVGVMFQTGVTKGTSEVVSIPVVKHFIQDYEKNGTFTGFPIFAANWQNMENDDLRTCMGMQSNQQGILIGKVEPNYPEFQALKPHDVVLSIDGIKIANDGRVPFMQGRHIDFSYLVMQKFVGDNILLEVLRNSKVHKFSIKLPTHKQFVPANTKGRPLAYFVISGIVFTTLSIRYLQHCEFGVKFGYLNDNLMSIALNEERVVVCEVIKNDINAGYEEVDLVNRQVLFFNGKPIAGMKSLITMVESCNDEFMKFEFDNDQVVVLDTEKAKATKPEFIAYHLESEGFLRMQEILQLLNPKKIIDTIGGRVLSCF